MRQSSSPIDVIYQEVVRASIRNNEIFRTIERLNDIHGLGVGTRGKGRAGSGRQSASRGVDGKGGDIVAALVGDEHESLARSTDDGVRGCASDGRANDRERPGGRIK